METSKVTLKDSMSYKEMEQACQAEIPFFKATRPRVGRYAKSKGYEVLKKLVGRKQIYFYVKRDVVNATLPAPRLNGKVKDAAPRYSDTIQETCYSPGLYFFPHLYNNALELLASVRHGILFVHLFGEYMERLTSQQDLLMPFSMLSISEATGMNRRSMESIMNDLCNIGVASMRGKLCTFNMPYVLKVLSLYDDVNYESKPLIKDAFWNHDVQRLQSYGIDDVELSEEVNQILNLINKNCNG